MHFKKAARISGEEIFCHPDQRLEDPNIDWVKRMVLVIYLNQIQLLATSLPTSHMHVYDKKMTIEKEGSSTTNKCLIFYSEKSIYT
jgi:hypothetical protein